MTESISCPASSVGRNETLNLRVVGSSPTLGADHFCWHFFAAGFPPAKFINNLASN